MAEYDSRRAWLRALVFFIVATSIGVASGVTHSLLAQPFASPGQLDTPGWWLATGAYALIVAVGYGVVWPQGTLSHGRRLRAGWLLLFGVAWGLAQGQIFLSIWTWIGLLGWGTWWTALATYGAIAAYNGLWHSLYWDIHVSPPHNIESWNGRKIALAHTPNLLFTLAYLAIFGFEAAWVVVAMQTLALLLSCWFMRFPAPGDPGAPEPVVTP